jgi:hypothetical protein
MKRKQPPATAQEGLPNPTAKVSITEVAPDADQLLEQFRKDPALVPGTVRQLIKHAARLIEVAPLIEKGKKRAEAEKRGARATNQKKKQKAETNYQEYREIAARIVARDTRLLSRWALATKVAKELLKQRRPVDRRTIWKALEK